MSLPELSIKRPIFVTCLVLLSLVIGLLSMQKLGVDLFPNISFPVVFVSTPYPGAGPQEVETLVSKPLEEEIGTLPGIKALRSTNSEGMSMVVAEFTLETDVKYAEQQVRDRVASAKRKLPTEIKEPVVRRLDPSDQPIIMLALTSDIPEGQLYSLADEFVRPRLEQVSKVGLVEIVGGRKREIQVQLDRSKLKSFEISALQVSQKLGVAGQNIPLGKVSEGEKDTVFRTLGEFRNLQDIENTVVNFGGNEVPVKVKDVGAVKDTLVDEKSRSFVNGKKSLMIMVFRQSGANTIAVADAVKKRIVELNSALAQKSVKAEIGVVRDATKMIRDNVDDVRESIMIGIALTIMVVFFFLGSARSTVITGLALPNSLIGAFILMYVCGFTINVMTLLALSLSVGLLVDDAIVVRENIFRHIELGMPARKAALEGTKEVMLAVLATTLTVIAVFGPIAFLQGVVGQFFKEFGLTICFAMLISLFDALTVAPMLSANFAGHGSHGKPGIFERIFSPALKTFDRFQTGLENSYEKLIRYALVHPMKILGIAFGIFVLSLISTKKVPKTFLPAQDYGEFVVSLDMPPGTNIEKMSAVSMTVDKVIRDNPEVKTAVTVIGDRQGEANTTQIFVVLVPRKLRTGNTSQFKDKLRAQLKPYAYANPMVKDYDAVGGGMRPFNVNIVGTDMEQLEKIAQTVFEKIKNHPGLKDPDITYRPGKPEFQVVIDDSRAERFGVSRVMVGQELRTHIEGTTPTVFRQNGQEYDVRVRLQEDQRNLREGYPATFVPNLNGALVKLDMLSQPKNTQGPANIYRQDRARYIQIAADIAPDGPGMGGVMDDINKLFANDVKLPAGMSYAFVGQAENFKELVTNMIVAMFLGILFIYFVLSSLYESFIIPMTIMLALPLAVVGAFFALLVTQQSLDLFSMIGLVMLMGIATKNSIILVDYANQLVGQGMPRAEALLKAGKTRLRPILMTTVALIAGMLPIAIGLNEASKQRTSMGIAIIGGLLSSTVLTLLVVPAAFTYVDRFRVWVGAKFKSVQSS